MIDNRSNPLPVRALSAILWSFDKLNRASKMVRSGFSVARASWHFITKLWQADQAVREAQQRREEKLRQMEPQVASMLREGGGLRPKRPAA